MPTIQEILGEKPVTIDSILGGRPISEEPTQKIGVEPENDREKFIKDQYFEVTGQEFPIGTEAKINIPPEIRAIPPTLWELVKSQIPGTRLLSQEFKQGAWWLSKTDLPPEFDTKDFTLNDIVKLNEEAQKQLPTKAQIIAGEATNLTSFFLFPAQMKMLGELVGPPVLKYAPTLYKILTKEIKIGGKIPKIPEGEINSEVKVEVKPTEEIIQNKYPILYHGSNTEGAKIIDKTGLIGGGEERIFLTPDYGAALEHAKAKGGKVYKVESKDLNPEWLEGIEKGPVSIPQKELGGKGIKTETISEKPPTFEEALTQSEAKTAKLREIQARFAEGEGPFESTVKYDPHQAMAEAGTESMVEKGIKRDPDKLMTEQLVEEWLANPSKYEQIIGKYGMTPKEWAGIMREQASSWGRKLGELGIEAQRLGKEMPEIAEALSELEKIAKMPSVWDRVQNGWKNIDRVRRGLLVTQLSTAMRNGFSQAARVGMDIPEKAMNYYFQRLFGMEAKGSALDGVEQFLSVLQRGKSKQIAETVLEAFPKQYSRMYSTYMSDIEVGKIGQNISKGVDILNTANRFQEFLFRNGVFSASLEQELRKQGLNLVEIIEKGTLKEIPKEAIEKSVHNALEMTFAETPKYGTIGKKFVDFVTSMPGATFILPFPRFMINSLKFNFEYSPLGLLKLLSPAERAAFAAGDVHIMSRAIMGSAMLGTAWQIRNSEFAGEKWNEIKVGKKTFDMIAYNPFIVYLFIADIIKKSNEGTLYKFTSKDVSMGVLSTNMRAGVGLYALDEVINGLSKTGDPQKAVDVLKTFAGETVAGTLTPLNQVKELLTGFDDYIVKEKRSEPFLGPIKEKIPIVEKALPVLYSATREGPVTRELPALRQTTGAMIKTKNLFEKEIDRLGFSYQEIFHSTGDPEADNSIKKYMGIMATRMAIPIIESKEYQDLTEGQKALVLANLLNEIRSTAKQAANEENPNLFARIKLEKIPKRERIVMEEQGIDIKELEKQLTQ
jgi:hypothetical protein